MVMWWLVVVLVVMGISVVVVTTALLVRLQVKAAPPRLRAAIEEVSLTCGVEKSRDGACLRLKFGCCLFPLTLASVVSTPDLTFERMSPYNDFITQMPCLWAVIPMGSEPVSCQD